MREIAEKEKGDSRVEAGLNILTAWAGAEENANLLNDFLGCLDKVIRAMITIYPLDQKTIRVFTAWLTRVQCMWIKAMRIHETM